MEQQGWGGEHGPYVSRAQAGLDTGCMFNQIAANGSEPGAIDTMASTYGGKSRSAADVTAGFAKDVKALN